MASDTAAPRNRKARVTAPAPPPPPPNEATNAKATTMCGKNLRWTAVALARKMAEVRERPSSLVCDEVAADAAAEARALHPSCDVHAVERNTRRRVYDALKVMCALGCITRVEKTKTLVWVGPYAAARRGEQQQQNTKPQSPAAKELAEKVASARASVGRKRARARQLCAALSNYDAHVKRRRVAGDSDDSTRLSFPFVLTAGVAPVKMPESADSVRLSFPKPVNIYTETDVVALLAPRPKSRRLKLKRPRVSCPQTPVANVKSVALVTSPATAERHVVPPTPPPALSLHHENDALNVDTHVLLKPKAELIGDNNNPVGVPKVELELMDDDDTPWREDASEQHALGDLRCLDNADFDS